MSEPRLEEIRTALQSVLVDEEDPEELGVLTGYIVIGQWAAPDGGEWFTRHAGNVNDDPASSWACKGWLTHALDSVDAVTVEEDED